MDIITKEIIEDFKSACAKYEKFINGQLNDYDFYGFYNKFNSFVRDRCHFIENGGKDVINELYSYFQLALLVNGDVTDYRRALKDEEFSSDYYDLQRIVAEYSEVVIEYKMVQLLRESIKNEISTISEPSLYDRSIDSMLEPLSGIYNGEEICGKEQYKKLLSYVTEIVSGRRFEEMVIIPFEIKGVPQLFVFTIFHQVYVSKGKDSNIKKGLVKILMLFYKLAETTVNKKFNGYSDKKKFKKIFEKIEIGINP